MANLDHEIDYIAIIVDYFRKKQSIKIHNNGLYYI